MNSGTSAGIRGIHKAVPIIRLDAFDSHPEFLELLGSSDGRLTDNTMQSASYEVYENQIPALEVVSELLVCKCILK